jgi:GntR family transcriptional regulator, carbon starvation induced regulator
MPRTTPASATVEMDYNGAPDIGDAPSIGEFVLRRLRADILSTELKPGMKLPFYFLTKMYGVGASPLRDALARLAGDGLVVLNSQKGYWVAPVSVADLQDVSELRRRLELMALELAVERGDEAWRTSLRAAYVEFCKVKQRVGDEAPITDDWEWRHRAFHLTLLAACGSPTLLRFCEQIHDRFHRYRRLALPTRSFMSALGDDHSDVMEAALNGDKARAVSLLDRHLTASITLVAENYKFDKPPPMRRRSHVQ